MLGSVAQIIGCSTAQRCLPGSSISRIVGPVPVPSEGTSPDVHGSSNDLCTVAINQKT